MKRRRFTVLLTSAATAPLWPCITQAQLPAAMPVIGYLDASRRSCRFVKEAAQLSRGEMLSQPRPRK